MFRDSFAKSLIPLMEGDFARSVFVWNSRVDRRAVRGEDPEALIFEVAERHLGVVAGRDFSF